MQLCLFVLPSHHQNGSVSNENKYTLDPGMTTFKKEEKNINSARTHLLFRKKTVEIIRFGRLSITASFKIE